LSHKHDIGLFVKFHPEIPSVAEKTAKYNLRATASELILEWSRRGEARRAESRGWGSWGEDSQLLPTN